MRVNVDTFIGKQSMLCDQSASRTLIASMCVLGVIFLNVRRDRGLFSGLFFYLFTISFTLNAVKIKSAGYFDICFMMHVTSVRLRQSVSSEEVLNQDEMKAESMWFLFAALLSIERLCTASPFRLLTGYYY